MLLQPEPGSASGRHVHSLLGGEELLRQRRGVRVVADVRLRVLRGPTAPAWPAADVLNLLPERRLLPERTSARVRAVLRARHLLNLGAAQVRVRLPAWVLPGRQHAGVPRLDRRQLLGVRRAVQGVHQRYFLHVVRRAVPHPRKQRHLLLDVHAWVHQRRQQRLPSVPVRVHCVPCWVLPPQGAVPLNVPARVRR